MIINDSYSELNEHIFGIKIMIFNATKFLIQKYTTP